jgi:predicted NBD/HSP70 family sugar kinase
MVRKVKALTKDWSYDVVSIGYPGPVINNRPLSEPHNLGRGWAGFNFEKAFGRPTKVVNDALMQAIGSYQGGRMLFLGLGTGLGSAMIVDGILEPMELAHLPYRNGKTFEQCVGAAALKRVGRKKWQRAVDDCPEASARRTGAGLHHAGRRKRRQDRQAAAQGPARRQHQRVRGRISAVEEGRGQSGRRTPIENAVRLPAAKSAMSSRAFVAKSRLCSFARTS